MRFEIRDERGRWFDTDTAQLLVTIEHSRYNLGGGKQRFYLSQSGNFVHTYRMVNPDDPTGLSGYRDFASVVDAEDFAAILARDGVHPDTPGVPANVARIMRFRQE